MLLSSQIWPLTSHRDPVSRETRLKSSDTKFRIESFELRPSTMKWSYTTDMSEHCCDFSRVENSRTRVEQFKSWMNQSFLFFFCFPPGSAPLHKRSFSSYGATMQRMHGNGPRHTTWINKKELHVTHTHTRIQTSRHGQSSSHLVTNKMWCLSIFTWPH